MKSMLPSVICILLISGCTLKLNTRNEVTEREETDPGIDGKIFASAMVFPAAEDWRESDCPGKLILLADGTIRDETEDFPTGREHFILGGNLYFGRDSTAESIWDVARDGKTIYELCTDSLGTFVRKDSEIMLRCDGCYPASDFYVDEGKLCADLCGDFFGVIRGSEATLWKKSEFSRLASCRLHSAGGVVWYVAEQGYAKVGKLRTSAGSGEKYLGMLYDGDGIYFEKRTKNGCYQITNSSKNRLYTSTEAFTREISAIDGNDIWAVGKLSDGSWAVCHEGRLAALPEGVRPRPGCRISVKYGRILFPVTTTDGSAAIYDTGKITNLGFNGYVEHISIGRGSSKEFYLSW